MWGGIAYLFPNFNNHNIELSEWIRYFIPTLSNGYNHLSMLGFYNDGFYFICLSSEFITILDLFFQSGDLFYNQKDWASQVNTRILGAGLFIFLICADIYEHHYCQYPVISSEYFHKIIPVGRVKKLWLKNKAALYKSSTNPEISELNERNFRTFRSTYTSQKQCHVESSFACGRCYGDANRVHSR